MNNDNPEHTSLAAMENSEKNPAPPTENSRDETPDTANNISKVIDIFIHRVHDIEDCGIEYISAAAENYNKNAENLKTKIQAHQTTLENEKEENIRITTIRELRKTIREIERHNSSSPATTLEKSLFISLFSVFDKFVGDLIESLYDKNQNLYMNINKEISLSEALKYDSMEELKQLFLEKEIEAIRRKSYAEQFKDFESRFSIKLTKFSEWPDFIECAQRRNLFTHCDGVVSKQYLDTCRDAGFRIKDSIKIGDQLEIGPNYLFKSCMLIAQVGVMLGHTLWRKIAPGELETADSHLTSIVFNYLQMEHWGKAISISNFANNLPRISTDQMQRIFLINSAIALKAINKGKAAKSILDKSDWSASTYDFKLAYAILTEDYAEAEAIMRKIGREGELVSELAYHDWPLFREFRDTKEFYRGYEAVYGYKYSSKLNELAESKKAEVEESDSI